MDDETKQKLRAFVLAVINGTNLIKSTECKRLNDDPNPEWFSAYNDFGIKMHTSLSRDGISGLKIYRGATEYSFFNVGYGQKPVGPSKAVWNFAGNFEAWTACLTWDEVKQFMAKLLADSKAQNKYVWG